MQRLDELEAIGQQRLAETHRRPGSIDPPFERPDRKARASTRHHPRDSVSDERGRVIGGQRGECSFLLFQAASARADGDAKDEIVRQSDHDPRRAHHRRSDMEVLTDPLSCVRVRSVERSLSCGGSSADDHSVQGKPVRGWASFRDRPIPREWNPALPADDDRGRVASSAERRTRLRRTRAKSHRAGGPSCRARDAPPSPRVVTFENDDRVLRFAADASCRRDLDVRLAIVELGAGSGQCRRELRVTHTKSPCACGKGDG
jgi:hypothetical protein